MSEITDIKQWGIQDEERVYQTEQLRETIATQAQEIATQTKEIEKLRFIQGPTDKTLANVLGELATANKKIEMLREQRNLWLCRAMKGDFPDINPKRIEQESRNEDAEIVAALSDEVKK